MMLQTPKERMLTGDRSRVFPFSGWPRNWTGLTLSNLHDWPESR